MMSLRVLVTTREPLTDIFISGQKDIRSAFNGLTTDPPLQFGEFQ